MSSSNRDEMIKNLNEIVVPALRQLGFKGSFPHFRRLTTDRINLLTFQFDRYGGGFCIEIANVKNEPFKISAQLIEQNRLTCHMVGKRMRIQSIMHENGDSPTEDWFRYDKKHLFDFGDIYKNICKVVLSKLNIADHYWKNGELN
jgi:hypothetical protein